MAVFVDLLVLLVLQSFLNEIDTVRYYSSDDWQVNLSAGTWYMLFSLAFEMKWRV